MCEKNSEWANEMMEIEDQVLEEMREDYRRRLAKRLQEKLKEKEKDMPEVQRLKKKARPAVPEKHPREHRPVGNKGLLPHVEEVGRPGPEVLAACEKQEAYAFPAAQVVLHCGGDRLLREGVKTRR
jgi:hypothetical protein